MSDHGQTRLQLGLGLAICICLAYTAGFAVFRLRNEVAAGRFTGPADMRVFWEAWSRVERHFFGEVPDPQTRTYGAIRRSLALLDPYTVFVEPVPRELEQDQLRGAYGGIGVTVWRNAAGHIALAPYPASPAERAGLVRGDVLLAIDDEPVRDGTTESEVEAELRGEIGTQVNLTIKRPSELPFVTVIERERIEVPSVTWHMTTSTIGYVQIVRFTERTEEELGIALQGLQQAGSTAWVLDLRGNRGGLLDSAVAVASRFLKKGEVVLYQAGGGDRPHSFAARGGGDLATPLVVLVDGDTASAAEIVAGALQDHGRALLIGEPTFGKGSVQEIYDLSDGSSVHVTAAIWLTPDRHRIDDVGLTPDLLVSGSESPSDAPLSRAVNYLESE